MLAHRCCTQNVPVSLHITDRPNSSTFFSAMAETPLLHHASATKLQLPECPFADLPHAKFWKQNGICFLAGGKPHDILWSFFRLRWDLKLIHLVAELLLWRPSNFLCWSRTVTVIPIIENNVQFCFRFWLLI